MGCVYNQLARLLRLPEAALVGYLRMQNGLVTEESMAWDPFMKDRFSLRTEMKVCCEGDAPAVSSSIKDMVGLDVVEIDLALFGTCLMVCLGLWTA